MTRSRQEYRRDMGCEAQRRGEARRVVEWYAMVSNRRNIEEDKKIMMQMHMQMQKEKIKKIDMLWIPS